MYKIKKLFIAAILMFGMIAGADAASNFPGGVSSFGVPVLPGIGGNIYSGNVFWVDSGHAMAADSVSNGSKDSPFKTIDYAVGRTAANNGDVIIVVSGGSSYSENVTFDIAGLTVIFGGYGEDRSFISLPTSTSTSSIDIDAASVVLINALIKAGTATVAIDVNASDFRMIGCETRDISTELGDSSGASATVWIKGDANADRLWLVGHTHVGTDSTPSDIGEGAVAGVAPRSFMELTGEESVIVRDCPSVYGNFDHAVFVIGTGTASTRFSLSNCYIWNKNSHDIISTATASSTGRMGPDLYLRIADNAANITEAVQGANMQFYQPISIVNNDGEVGTNTNIPYSTD